VLCKPGPHLIKPQQQQLRAELANTRTENPSSPQALRVKLRLVK